MKQTKNNMIWLLPLLPLTLGIFSLIRNCYSFKITVTLLLLCFGITVFLIQHSRNAQRCDWLLAVAYLCCIGGDSFLFHRGSNPWLFVMGILLFGAMHLNYLFLMRCYGTFNKRFGVIFTCLLLGYFMFFLLPLKEMALELKIAVLLYLLLSCLTLSFAVSLRFTKLVKSLFIIAISLMIFSDTTVSLKEFLHWEKLNFLLMPTYYFSLIFMCLAMSAKLHHSAAVCPSRNDTPIS
ncbi:MAG: lysoplasmalogenase family protein [Lentisphaeria bacterium]